MEKIYVIGHKNPDTDTIVAAIGYAYFKNEVDKDDEYIPARSGDLNDETKLVMDRFKVSVPKLLTNASGKKVILIDHNEMGQVIDGVENATILEIIDHHRLGDIQTSAPILFHSEPVGSSSTIVADFLKYHKIKIPNDIASILLAGILSDTVILRSPTTTEKDKRIAKELAKQTSLDIQAFGLEIKKAKSSIAKMTANEVIMNDFKEYEKNRVKYGVGQIEIVDYSEAIARRDEIMTELEAIRVTSGYRIAILMVTNIIEEATKLWFTGDSEIIRKISGKEPKDGEVYMEKWISRKLQVVPKIQEVL